MAAIDEYGLQRILVIGEWRRACVACSKTIFLNASAAPVVWCTGNVDSHMMILCPGVPGSTKSAMLHEALAVPDACSCCVVRFRRKQSPQTACCQLLLYVS